MMKELVSIREAADLLGCRPRDISDAKYAGQISVNLFVRIGRTTAIPKKSLPKLRRVLAELGKVTSV